MISLEVALSFFGASVVLALTPGPDILFVLTQSLIGGPRRGLVFVAGLCSGLVVHTALVASGLAAAFAASPVAFTILKIAGACYLLWLAWCSFWAPVKASDSEAQVSDAKEARCRDDLRGWKLYRRGVIMNLTNPKLIIFILAFWMPFTDPARGSVWLQLIELGALCVGASVLVFGVVAVAAGSVGQKLLGSQRAQWFLARFSGVIFLVLALWLFWECAHQLKIF